MNFITLKKTYLIEAADSRKTRPHTPGKKVSEEDSGGWQVSGKKVAPERNYNVKNINVKAKKPCGVREAYLKKNQMLPFLIH